MNLAEISWYNCLRFIEIWNIFCFFSTTFLDILHLDIITWRGWSLLNGVSGIQHLLWSIKIISPCSTESQAFVSLSMINSRWHVSSQWSSQAFYLMFQSVEVISLYLTKPLDIILFLDHQAFQFTFIMKTLLMSNAHSWVTHVHF